MWKANFIQVNKEELDHTSFESWSESLQILFFFFFFFEASTLFVKKPHRFACRLYLKNCVKLPVSFNSSSTAVLPLYNIGAAGPGLNWNDSSISWILCPT